MAEGFWEQAVEVYLTLDRGLFLNSQYLVGEPNEWNSDIDFLALRFPESEVWMVEVTKADPSNSLFPKITNFDEHYVPRIKGQLVEKEVIREQDPWTKWRIGLWVFVRDVYTAKTRMHLERSGVIGHRITRLEDVSFPSWDDRFR